jgi:FlaA1/EpsC-like NDP-sugar epimerase
LKYSPVGFLDDDPAKSGKVIHGLKVFACNGDVALVCKQHEVDELLISSARMSEERVQEILRHCGKQEISVRRMRITIEELRLARDF